MAGLVVGVTHRGAVVPPPELLRRLDAECPGVSLKHYPGESRAWGVLLRWREDDPRHALIRTGELGNHPFDQIGWLPTHVSLDEAVGYIQRHLTTSSREDARRMADAMSAANAKRQDEALSAPFDQALEIVQHVGAAAMVTGDASRKKARSRGADFKPAA
jgi:hypothetical protein